jgi:hypothetical protein
MFIFLYFYEVFSRSNVRDIFQIRKVFGNVKSIFFANSNIFQASPKVHSPAITDHCHQKKIAEPSAFPDNRIIKNSDYGPNPCQHR